MPAFADDDYVPEDGTTYNSKAQSHEALEDFLLGEKALKANQTDKAVMYLRRAVEAKGSDMDARVAFAGALEDKYRKQEDKDPKLFRECLSQWLYVLRTIPPEESGVSVLKFLYKDEERDMPAKVHIKGLAGRLPKPWETNDKFLSKVCRGDATVSATVLKAAPKAAPKKLAKPESDDY